MATPLSPETEARLCERAAREGQDVNVLANAQLTQRLQDDEAAKEEAFERALLSSGLVTHIPPPRDPSKAERPTFVVQGEPLSETIMRERR